MYSRIYGIAALIVFLLGNNLASAQDRDLLTNETLMKNMLKQSSFAIDTSAQAVILYEKGEAVLERGLLTFKIERIIKINGTEGINELSTINVPISKSSIIRKIKGETYNLDQELITKQSIEKADVLNDKTTAYVSVTKFNLPAVKSGSVIHYTYTVESPEYLFIPEWHFQQNFPTLYSEYEIKLLGVIDYMPITTSAIPFKPVKSKNGLSNCEACSFSEGYGNESANTQIWVRRNVPAFKKEPFMSSSENYLEKVKIHVASITIRGYVTSVYDNWEHVTEAYYKNDNFCGQVFKANNFLNDQVKFTTAGKKTDMEKAKAIYSFVRDHIKLKKESYNDFSALSDISDVYKRREGNSNGINLLLIAMLRNAGFQSEPVLLPSRSEERLDPLLPNPGVVDYVVGIIKIDGKDYFLDASEKHMPFGILPSACYNGYCRIISKVPAAAELHPDDLKNKGITMMSLLPDEKSKDKLLLKVDQKFGDVSGALLRDAYKGDSTKLKEKIQKNLNTLSIPATLIKYSFSSLDNADEPLTVHYEAALNWDAKDIVYMDPYFEKLYDINPFTAASRKYPVEMDYLSDHKYIFHFQLPQGYTVDDFPKSSVIKLGSNELVQMKNVLAYDAENKVFDIDCRYIAKTTVFPAEVYNQLRSFHDNIIAEQHKKIVLKKTN
jgi:hypothetical protein